MHLERWHDARRRLQGRAVRVPSESPPDLGNAPMPATVPVHCTMVSIVALRGNAAGSEVLLVQRASAYLNGVWSYVAGHIEAGETAPQAARRELAEETGLTPASLYATSFCEQFYSAQTGAVEIVPAFVALIAADARVRLNGEHTAFRWTAFNAAAQAVPFGSQRDLFAQIRREFIERSPNELLRIQPA